MKVAARTVRFFHTLSELENLLSASFVTFEVKAGQEVHVPARLVGAKGTAVANGSWSIDNGSFDEAPGETVSETCTPRASDACRSLPYLGCEVQSQSGVCTGWQPWVAVDPTLLVLPDTFA